ncbi:MAG: hypothetical protein J7598_06140 [Mitsuaria chitosanitabida]|jgi:hypothetical protein|uniref:hypothetical protein n=1 Tax=Roseateles chitosanitabidus TaxID=65048 RepID=UPI001B0D7487|nr:hypothetical protein [Roseateles chitosanitabidus]MBO9686171.1 hypothetical protein [Roseateles chitosanitabidus]
MLIWGSKGAVADLGVQAHHHCQTCERERPFKLALQYKIHHLYHVFQWVSSKKYLLVCDVCQRGAELPAKEVEPKLTKNPIPATQRFGWLGLVLVIGALGVYGKIASDGRSHHVTDYTAAPAVGDLYVIDLNKLTGESGSTYGVIRVKQVADDKLELEMPHVGYNKVRGAERDIGDASKLNGAGYFEDKTVSVPLTTVQAWAQQGAIHDIERH